MNPFIMNKASAGSLPDRIAAQAREKMYAEFLAFVDLSQVTSVLDVGATADDSFVSSNFLEKYYPHTEHITALSNQDAVWLEGAYPGLKFVSGDARNMPFDDNSMDIVFSSAVIEHVGNTDNQREFFLECVRVARKFVFITTPNRFYPIEFHTLVPLVHWLPPHYFRLFLKYIGMHELAQESVLNLCSMKFIQQLCCELDSNTTEYSIRTINTFLYPSNILICITKKT